MRLSKNKRTVTGMAEYIEKWSIVKKKHRFQGHDLDFEHIAKELGDVAWYLAVGAYAIGYDLETILQMNVDKLKARYPDGFSADRSLHRDKNDV